jgi:CheY-like chemotaxis protein
VKPGGLILVAEDDENDVTFLRRAFRQAEITNPLQIVSDGQAVIDYLSGVGEFADRAQYPIPCLVLLDLKMPRKTGMEALAWIRGSGSFYSVPVIMLTSSVHPAEIGAAYQTGANAFVTKPSDTVDRTELAQMIKGFWLIFNETT